MRLLLDTHAFLWFVDGDASLSASARQAIADAGNLVYVSAASAWEITTKHRLGKLPGAAAMAADVAQAIVRTGFDPMPINVAHAQAAGALQGALKDPFDRMLIAQALLEGVRLVSNEVAFDPYGVQRLW